jgi:hypothetical protein
MDTSKLADLIIIAVAAGAVFHVFVNVAAAIIDDLLKWDRKRKRNAQYKVWIAARVAARLETEARLREEGYWSNTEIGEAMDAAGKAAAPGYRPWGA